VDILYVSLASPNNQGVCQATRRFVHTVRTAAMPVRRDILPSSHAGKHTKSRTLMTAQLVTPPPETRDVGSSAPDQTSSMNGGLDVDAERHKPSFTSRTGRA